MRLSSGLYIYVHTYERMCVQTCTQTCTHVELHASVCEHAHVLCIVSCEFPIWPMPYKVPRVMREKYKIGALALKDLAADLVLWFALLSRSVITTFSLLLQTASEHPHVKIICGGLKKCLSNLGCFCSCRKPGSYSQC